MSLEESIERLEMRIESLLRDGSARQEGFRRGFEKGVVFALLMARGFNVFDPDDKDLRGLREGPTPPRKRGQLDLF